MKKITPLRLFRRPRQPQHSYILKTSEEDFQSGHLQSKFLSKVLWPVPLRRPSQFVRNARPASPISAVVKPESIDDNADSSSSISAIEQAYDDIIGTLLPHRKEIHQSVRISVFVGDHEIGNIPKRAAIVASPVLNAHITAHPGSSAYHHGAEDVDPNALSYILPEWLVDGFKPFKAFDIPSRGNFGDNIAVLHAARLMEIERYARPVINWLLDHFEKTLPSYEQISLAEWMAISD